MDEINGSKERKRKNFRDDIINCGDDNKQM